MMDGVIFYFFLYKKAITTDISVCRIKAIVGGSQSHKSYKKKVLSHVREGVER